MGISSAIFAHILYEETKKKHTHTNNESVEKIIIANDIYLIDHFYGFTFIL